MVNPIQVAPEEPNNRNRPINEYGTPKLDELGSCIIRPTITALNFELKPVMFNMLNAAGQFGGHPSEDPHAHLMKFMMISDSFIMAGVTKEALRLMIFPYSLRDLGKDWLDSLQPQSINTWEDLTGKFLRKFFPPPKTTKLRNDILGFRQLDQESLYEAWERFKEMLKKCQHHGIAEYILMQTFYNGLHGPTRALVDATAGGTMLSKSYDESWEILDTMAYNNHSWTSERATSAKSTPERLELDAITALSAQMAILSNKVDKLGQKPEVVQQVQFMPSSCVTCGGAHTYDMCPGNPEAVNYLGNNY
ncbi:hypothetical protein ACJIZ3_008779 [Penstemon smallii]|uniref:Retrotransposon gag domain-containing protein n=1 Tax=Penstemon smallii TaxID=265156 RepID=A0ABD3TCC4_9LAMI